MLKRERSDEELEELEADLKPAFTRALADALRRPGGDLEASAVQDALSSGLVDPLVDSVPWQEHKEELTALWVAFLLAVLRRMWAIEAARLGVSAIFDPRRPEVAAFLGEQVPALAGAVAEESRQALEAILRQALTEGLPPSRLAQRIRESVGLTERQALAVARRWALLAQDPAVPAHRADALVDAYARTLLQSRALAIAETEITRAMAQGARYAWLEAQAEGKLPRTAMVEWVARLELGGVCPGCVALDGTLVAMGQPWISSQFGVLHGPPAHVRCRCYVRIRRR